MCNWALRSSANFIYLEHIVTIHIKPNKKFSIKLFGKCPPSICLPRVSSHLVSWGLSKAYEIKILCEILYGCGTLSPTLWERYRLGCLITGC